MLGIASGRQQTRFRLFGWIFLVITAVLGAPDSPAGPESVQLATLKVGISGLEEKGTIHVGLYDDATGFEEGEIFKGLRLEPAGSELEATFLDVPEGRYGVAIFQDVNGNGVLDRYVIGYPSEPFGFSRNPRILFGPPDFEEIAFAVRPGKTAIAVKLN